MGKKLDLGLAALAALSGGLYSTPDVGKGIEAYSKMKTRRAYEQRVKDLNAAAVAKQLLDQTKYDDTLDGLAQGNDVADAILRGETPKAGPKVPLDFMNQVLSRGQTRANDANDASKTLEMLPGWMNTAPGQMGGGMPQPPVQGPQLDRGDGQAYGAPPLQAQTTQYHGVTPGDALAGVAVPDIAKLLTGRNNEQSQLETNRAHLSNEALDKLKADRLEQEKQREAKGGLDQWHAPAGPGFNLNEQLWNSATPEQRQAMIDKAGHVGENEEGLTAQQQMQAGQDLAEAQAILADPESYEAKDKSWARGVVDYNTAKTSKPVVQQMIQDSGSTMQQMMGGQSLLRPQASPLPRGGAGAAFKNQSKTNLDAARQKWGY